MLINLDLITLIGRIFNVFVAYLRRLRPLRCAAAVEPINTRTPMALP
jgi:hypothetical protein